MGEGCEEMHLLIQADVDHELTPAEAARVAVHVESCAGCKAIQADLSVLSTRVRGAAVGYAAPGGLRAAVRGRIAAELGVVRAGSPGGWWWRPGMRLGVGGALGGFALAACLVVAVMVPRDGGLAEAVVTDHIRSLQPGHLMDVVSTDQHTVKPWFDGRLSFAPPVKDFAAEGFPLAGGRLDYLAGRDVAALVYRSRQHVIEVFVWPGGGIRGPGEGSRSGYNFVQWSADGMTLWAVSDLNAGELGGFVRLWRGL